MAGLLAVVVAASAVLLGSAPILLTKLSGQADDWDELSNIATTYGVVSTIISVLALSGVAVSLLYQAKEVKGSREQTLRSLHVDLMKLSLEDELYRSCWGPDPTSNDPDEDRAQIFINMIVSHWQLMFELDAMTEEELRYVSNTMFHGPHGRLYWTYSREPRLRSAASRRERRLYEILDEEFQRAADDLDSEGPPDSPE